MQLLARENFPLDLGLSTRFNDRNRLVRILLSTSRFFWHYPAVGAPRLPLPTRRKEIPKFEAWEDMCFRIHYNSI